MARAPTLRELCGFETADRMASGEGYEEIACPSTFSSVLPTSGRAVASDPLDIPPYAIFSEMPPYSTLPSLGNLRLAREKCFGNECKHAVLKEGPAQTG